MPYTLLKNKQSIFIAIFTIFIAIFTINNYIEKNLFEYENMTSVEKFTQPKNICRFNRISQYFLGLQEKFKIYFLDLQIKNFFNQ